jgi:prophage antirepressor-like protein
MNNLIKKETVNNYHEELKKTGLNLEANSMENLITNIFDGYSIRTITDNEDIWFVAKDISDVLGYSETSAMIRSLDSDESIPARFAGMNMKSILINESGLYSSIMRSTLPNAKKFKKWVTSEVLPSIRKNGMYVKDKLLDDPDLLLDVIVKLKSERTSRLKAEKKVLKLSENNKVLKHDNRLL